MLVVAVLIGPTLVSMVFGVSSTAPTLAIFLAGLSPCAMAVAAPWVASARVFGHFGPVAWTRVGAAVVIWCGLLFVLALRTPTGYLGLLALQDVLIAVVAITVSTRAHVPGGIERTGDVGHRVEPTAEPAIG